MKLELADSDMSDYRNANTYTNNRDANVHNDLILHI